MVAPRGRSMTDGIQRECWTSYCGENLIAGLRGTAGKVLESSVSEYPSAPGIS